ncbi:hypothetical protein CGCA056_v005893 [Colletotrichum aenigma]|uniref:uncharacterized protein n=1 Tax=Colletotrichum aenigma TaxID=1215731 RepID=UPI001872CB6A|nr:uncharacterized protein CGCA056_v005893 [Colletotrichum aenigma]KAF5522711.1 hypothetical protein CGCA056_v005893 [Colletotrichum aenigma]
MILSTTQRITSSIVPALTFRHGYSQEYHLLAHSFLHSRTGVGRSSLSNYHNHWFHLSHVSRGGLCPTLNHL